MKKLGLVILTCSFLSSVELTGKNVKVLERSMRKHKAFCGCAQKIIYKITIDICSRIFTKNVPGWAHRLQLEAMGYLRPVCEGNIYGKRNLLSLEIIKNMGLGIIKNSYWRRKWQPTPVFLPGESQGRGSLVGCHLWGRTESDTTEAT